MTTIACTETEIAGDTQWNYGNERSFVQEPKVGVYSTKSTTMVWGYCGPKWLMDDALRYIQGITAVFPKADATWSAVWMSRPGELWYVANETPKPHRVAAPFAIGTGAAYAMGALVNGASATEAVRVASQLDLHTGGKVTTCCVVSAIHALAEAAE